MRTAPAEGGDSRGTSPSLCDSRIHDSAPGYPGAPYGLLWPAHTRTTYWLVLHRASVRSAGSACHPSTLLGMALSNAEGPQRLRSTAVLIAGAIADNSRMTVEFDKGEVVFKAKAARE